ncbi:MFS transporter [Subtercola endophyticus]|uniref:MFS transporter n=1 Tax=Subtercola endophyticus TaxID=2895559 RepID=UPI001E40600A|nr:MFS transporter [Subtercola endophyticus]UFS59241.1 MFS transporter [Subtercola endophyticus]
MSDSTNSGLTGPTGIRQRRSLPPTAAFVGTAAAFAALYLAAGAPTSLLVLFEKEWGFPAWVLTVAFAAYAIGLLVSLLIVGSLSDYLGRRPVLIASLALELVAMLMFVFASDITAVIVARVVQGIATGAATSALTASVVELAPERFKRLGAVIGGIAPAGGLGLGALFAGLAVQFTADADVVVFVTLSVVVALGLAVAFFSAETVGRQRGAVRSLVPRVSIPAAARAEFRATIPVLTGAWMLAGLFLGLAPTIIRDIFGIDSGLVNGVTVFIQPGAAAVAGLLLGGVLARRATLVGGVAVLVGAVIIVTSIGLGILPLMWVGALIGGSGFGASFSGSLRLVGPLAKPHQRAGLFAGVYLVSYLAFGVSVIIAGQLIAPLGLMTTVLAFGVAIVVVAGLGIGAQLRMQRRDVAGVAAAAAAGSAAAAAASAATSVAAAAAGSAASAAVVGAPETAVAEGAARSADAPRCGSTTGMAAPAA